MTEYDSTHSKWTIGWRTPTLILTSYIAACLIAAGHGILYSCLNGKPADEPTAQLPQSYTTTASVILTGIDWPKYESYNASFDFRLAENINDNPTSHLYIYTAEPGEELRFRNLSSGGVEATLDLVERRLDCVPTLAENTVHTVYENNIRRLNVTTDPASVYALRPAIRFISVPEAFIYGNGHLNQSVVPILRYMNLHMVIQQMADMISGSFNAYAGGHIGSDTVKNNTTTYHEISGLVSTVNGLGSSAATFTTLLQYFTSGNLSTTESYTGSSVGGLFTVNETILNTMLQDITLSLIPFVNLWTANVNQTITTPVNVYSFSQPINLILPYTLTLVGGLFVLVFGLIALHSNGVSATDGGFLQLLTTTRGSASLDKIARKGCLGGDENVPAALKSLKIQYGELVAHQHDDMDKDAPRVAGFGVEGEVSRLRRGYVYGG